MTRYLPPLGRRTRHAIVLVMGKTRAFSGGTIDHRDMKNLGLINHRINYLFIVLSRSHELRGPFGSEKRIKKNVGGPASSSCPSPVITKDLQPLRSMKIHPAGPLSPDK